MKTGKTYSESTENETPTVLRKWFWTRMKSNDDGTKITVFALCTADFNTPGSTCNKEGQCQYDTHTWQVNCLPGL